MEDLVLVIHANLRMDQGGGIVGNSGVRDLSGSQDHQQCVRNLHSFDWHDAHVRYIILKNLDSCGPLSSDRVARDHSVHRGDPNKL